MSLSKHPVPLVAAGTGLIAATYGLVRLAYGLFLPDVQDDLALGVAAAGAVSGAASVVYGIGALLGFLGAARHARALVVAAGLSAAIGAAGMAAAPNAATFAAFAVVSSAGAGLASPAMVAILQRNPATGGRPRSQAVVNAGTGPGLIAAGVLALGLLPNWRLAWFITAIFTGVVAGAVLIVDRARAGTISGRRALPPASWFAAHRAPLAAALLMGFGSAAVWNYGRALLAAGGASEGISVTAWIALGAGGSVVIATASRVERLGPPTAWMLTTGTVALASAALAAGPGNAWLALSTCAAFGWGYTAGTGALIAWTAQIDPPRAPAGTALLFITLILGQALGAATVGATAAMAGYTTAFLIAAAVAAIAAGPALVGRELRGSPGDRQRPRRSRPTTIAARRPRS